MRFNSCDLELSHIISKIKRNQCLFTLILVTLIKKRKVKHVAKIMYTGLNKETNERIDGQISYCILQQFYCNVVGWLFRE